MTREPHAITRARERYGIELTEGDLRTIARMAEAGETVVLSKQPTGHGIHLVQLEGRPAFEAAISADGWVTTVFPKGARHRKTRGLNKGFRHRPHSANNHQRDKNGWRGRR